MQKLKAYALILGILVLNLGLLLFLQRCSRSQEAALNTQMVAAAKTPCAPDELILEEWGFTDTWKEETPNPEFYYTFNIENRVISLIVPNSFMLSDFPNTLGCLNALQRLKIEGQRNLTLPESIGFLEELQELYLENNELKRLPASLGRLRNLRYLSLKQNLLMDVPALKNLQHLKVLILSDNLLSDEKLARIMSELKPSVRLIVHGS